MYQRILMPTILFLLTVCPEQTWRDPAQCPFTIDPAYRNQLLGWGVREIGTTAVFDANYCDPEGDPVTLTVSDPAMHILDVNAVSGEYTITTVVRAGTDYITVTATDQPGPYATPKTARGTFALLGVPENKPPVLGCGGLRP